MLYLLDANVLISAHELHYRLDRIPQFWIWLLAMAAADTVKLPYEIYNEIALSKGELKDWLTTPSSSKKLPLNAQVDPVILQRVINDGYAPDLNESELEQIGQDPSWWPTPYHSGRPSLLSLAKSQSQARRGRTEKCLTFAVSLG